MSKKKSTINFNTSNAKSFMKSMALCEGRMTKSDMEKLGSKKLSNELIRNYYVSRNNDGSYSSTDKLLKQYRDTFHPAKGFSYGSSISRNHSHGEAQVLSYMNKETLLKVNIQTARELSEEHKEYKKTEEYQKAIDAYEQEVKQELQSMEGNTDPLSYLKQSECKAMLELLASSHPTSPPDFALHNFPVSDIDKVCTKMEYAIYYNEDLSERELVYLNYAIQELNNIKEQAVYSELEFVSLSFEVITKSYNQEAIREKMICSKITRSNTIFIYQGGGG